MRKWFSHISLRFDRSFSKGLYKQVLWLLGIIVLVYIVLVALSYVRALYTPGCQGSHGRWYDILFLLIDPGSSSATMSSPFVVLCAVLGLVVFSGMLISVISNVLQRRVESFMNGETDYKMGDHVVVLGYNKSIWSLLKKIHKNHKHSFIVLMSERDTNEIRERIQANVSFEIEKHLILMNGMRYVEEDLRRLCLGNNVKEIYVLGEETELDHDTLNLECVRKIAGIVPEERGAIECHVQIDSNTMFAVLQAEDFAESKLTDDSAIKDHIKFLPFNFNEIWSQRALATIPSLNSGDEKIEYFPLDGEGGITSGSKRHVHFILVGMNDIAISMAVNAAHILHFPNFKEGDFATCTRITFIDNDAKTAGQLFRNRYRQLFKLARWRYIEASACLDDEKAWMDPWDNTNFPYRHLGDVNFLDIQWEFIDGDIINDDIQAYLETCSCHDDEITTIALCNEDSERNAELCLSLPESICKSANTILVRQKESAAVVDLISRMPYHNKVRPFGMMSECYRESLISDRFGKLINACYMGIDLSQSDLIEEAWNECKVLNRWSCVYSANMLLTKLRSMGLEEGKITENRISQLMSQEDIRSGLQGTEHYRWLTEKMLLGFSPLSEKEQIDWVASKENQMRLRSLNKHIDIRSNQMLIDADKQKDDSVNSNLWTIYNVFMEEVVNKIR